MARAAMAYRRGFLPGCPVRRAGTRRDGDCCWCRPAGDTIDGWWTWRHSRRRRVGSSPRKSWQTRRRSGADARGGGAPRAHPGVRQDEQRQSGHFDAGGARLERRAPGARVCRFADAGRWPNVHQSRDRPGVGQSGSANIPRHRRCGAREHHTSHPAWCSPRAFSATTRRASSARAPGARSCSRAASCWRRHAS